MTVERLVHLLRELDRQPPFALLDVLRMQLSRDFGAADTQLWLVDYEHQWLQRLRVSEAGSPLPQRDTDRIKIDDSDPGAVYRSQEVVTTTAGDGTLMRCPVTVRSERLAVLEIFLPAPPSSESVAALESVGSIVGHALLTARRYTDLFHRARRRQELHVAAELQWDLLPVLAHDGPDFCVAGMLEPAYDIAGDNFDYTVDADGVGIAVSDAMGHGLTGAMVSSLGVAALRNARRHGFNVRQQARSANLAVHDQFDGEAFLTNLTLHIDRRSGHATALNAGHAYGFILRGGTVHPLELPSDVPLGLFPDSEFTERSLQLQRGDRLLLVTDGVIEAAPEDGVEFGEDRVAELLRDMRPEAPYEAVRKLIGEVLTHRAAPLRDDATVVCVDYREQDDGLAVS